MAARLGPFEVLAPHAHGGMARVFRGRHVHSDHPVALKVMTLAATRPQAWHLQFSREIRAVARLEHPAVVRVYDHGVTDDGVIGAGLNPGDPYLVMEWLGGGAVDTGPAARDWQGLRRTALTLLDGLAHTHARGVLHLDLKPDNVLLCERGPVLTDFGLAVEGGRALETRRPLGTPGYMAPEQIAGHGHRFGPCTDLYGFGCLVWALLTGHPPHAADGVPAAGVAMAHLYEELPTFEPRFPVPAGLDRWLRRMLARDPRERFRFAADARAALVAWTTPGAIADDPRAPMPPDWRAPADAAARHDMLGVGRAMLGHRVPAAVGFEKIRDRLWSALRAVVDDGGLHMLCIAGASGQGKTHLADWLAEQAHRFGLARVLRATHDEPNGPSCGLEPMLRRAYGAPDDIGGSAAGAVEAEPSDTLMQRRAVAVERFLPPGATPRDRARALALIDPDGRAEVDGETIVLTTARDRHVAFGKLLRALGRERPVLVIFDDLQWGAAARALVAALGRARPAPPALILATVATDARAAPEVPLALFGAERIARLAPLTAAAHRRLLARQLPLDPRLVDALVERAGGSPLFAGELLRHWVGMHALVEGPAGYRLAPGAGQTLPRGMEGLWTARFESALGRLFADARDALEIGAVAGMVIEAGLWLEACGHAGVPWPAEAIDRLLDAGLLRALPGHRFRFAHAMLRESLIGWTRRDGRWLGWNACCAQVYRQRGERGAPVDQLRYARHLLEAGEPAAALAPLSTACRAALVRLEDHRASIVIGLQVGALRRLRLPRSAPEWAPLLLDAARVDQRQGRYRRARRRARRALVHPATRRDPALTCRALHILSYIDHYAIGPRVAIRHVEQAMPYAERAGDRTLLVWQLAMLGLNGMMLYRVAEAESALSRGLMLLEPADGQLEGYLRHYLSIAAGLRDDIDGGLERARRARQAFRAVGARRIASSTWQVEGDLRRRAGDVDGAARCYRRCREGQWDLGIAEQCYSALTRAMLALARGRWHVARKHLDTVAAAELGLVAVSLAIGRLCVMAGLGEWAHFAAAADAFDRIFADAPASPEVVWVAGVIADLADAEGRPRDAARARGWQAEHRRRVRAGG